MKTAVNYTIFAIIATLINLGAQEVTFRLISGPYSIYLAIFFGTGFGLVAKYILDKMFIFNVKAESAKQDAKMFGLYTLMGVVTTVIFWGTELTFHILFETKAMTYLGAVIGLAIGYIVKYYLDKKFVFSSKQENSGQKAKEKSL